MAERKGRTLNPEPDLACSSRLQPRNRTFHQVPLLFGAAIAIAMAGKVSLSSRAYSVLALHALKHPKLAVSGVLLGRSHADITNAVPLTHVALALAPCIEVALTLIAKHAEQSKEQIVGFYYADARGEKLTSVPPLVAKLGEAAVSAAQASGGDASGVSLLLLDADRAESGATALGLQLFVKGGGQSWTCAGDHSASGASGRLSVGGNPANLVDSYVDENRHERVVDFDDHFEDVEKDWRNAALTD